MFLNKKKILEDMTAIFGGESKEVIVNMDYYDYQDNKITDYETIVNSKYDESIIIDNSNYIVKAGSTKIVFIPKYNCDYVIKIPINGYYKEDSDGKLNYYHFSVDVGDNILDKETLLSESFQTKDKYFIPNVLVGKVGEIPIYVQQKISNLCSFSDVTTENHSSSYIKKLREKLSLYIPAYFSNQYIIDIVRNFGLSFFIKLCHDCDFVSDLCPDNFGYDSNNIPCCIDYGGTCYFIKDIEALDI